MCLSVWMIEGHWEHVRLQRRHPENSDFYISYTNQSLSSVKDGREEEEEERRRVINMEEKDELEQEGKEGYKDKIMNK